MNGSQMDMGSHTVNAFWVAHNAMAPDLVDPTHGHRVARCSVMRTSSTGWTAALETWNVNLVRMCIGPCGLVAGWCVVIWTLDFGGITI